MNQLKKRLEVLNENLKNLPKTARYSELAREFEIRIEELTIAIETLEKEGVGCCNNKCKNNVC